MVIELIDFKGVIHDRNVSAQQIDEYALARLEHGLKRAVPGCNCMKVVIVLSHSRHLTITKAVP